MVFSSVVFLFLFLPAVYIAYVLVPGIKAKNTILIAASIMFYAYGEPKAVILMLISIAINFALAAVIEKNRNKLYLCTALFFNIFLLFIFKYLNFFADILNYIFNVDIHLSEIHLPIGISFFTFQAMSYVIDVYRGEVRAQRSFPKLVLYISFFPQLIAGPIIKYHYIEEQLDKRSMDIGRTASGLKLFIFGLSAKLLIANTMGSIADYAFGFNTNELYPLLSWIGALAYTMQIYFDFSGYSNMAIGLGRMFGFDFADNFNIPFVSAGIKEFWRRWHISLSTWFREYVYIPLGGNRKGRGRTVLNQLIVFLLTGLWHGANMTFVVWGLIHGLFLVFEGSFKNVFEKVPRPLLHIYTMLVVILAFVIFRADTIGYGVKYICSMFIAADTANISRAVEICNPYNIAVFALGALLSVGLHKKAAALFSINAVNFAGYVFSLILFALCLINISASAYNPFIYFRF